MINQQISVMSVKENLEKIKNTIPPNVILIAVSKKKSEALIKETYEAGQKDFGENYVQELKNKFESLPKDIRWHFIGHLQSNKVRTIAPFVYIIQSVDSFKLLKEINKEGEKNKRIINCLLQIHVAIEESKFGFDTEECEELLKSKELINLKNIKICGFMGMASNTSNEKQIRTEFKKIKNIYEKWQHLRTFNIELATLSFGMSGDYKIAIEEGSNMIRIGSTIFGERN